MADDEFALLVTREKLQELRDDHDFLASMVRSPAQRRIVLYPSQRAATSTGGASLIQFTIDVDSVDCDAGTATGTVTDVICGATDPTVGDTVNLVDPLGFLIGNPALLANHVGFAVRMETDETVPYPETCSWKILSMDDLGYNCA